ncbi:MAG: hypothetical protein CVV02_00940 [Firmicutes bacterium HGW-Firmicutes-7]|nr:MAG: hypothetical protein CVV02_00940 [Firmicutes bacterium HGW-Firmicutes-7]
MKKNLLFRTILIGSLVALMLLSSTGCGRSKSSGISSSREETATEEAASDEDYKQEYYDNALSNADGDDYQTERKNILKKYFIMETIEFDTTIPAVESLVSKYLGYIENSEVTGKQINNTNYYNTRHAYYTFRIPAEKLKNFTEELKVLGNVVQERGNKEDVTTQYFDVMARINSLKVQEERLLELVKKGNELKDILEIENQLSNVRYQIETYTATMNNLDNQVNYGTVQLELKEVVEVTINEEPAVTIGEKISKGFIKSIDHIKDFFVNLFIFIIVAIPYIIVWAAIILALLITIKKLNSARKRKHFIKETENQSIIKSEESDDQK